MSVPITASSASELLCHYAQSRSTEVRNLLVQKNMGLVYKVAHQLAAQCREPYDDLAQIGALGLIRAIERFDPERGYSFSSFAMPYVRGEIQHYLRDRGHTVRLPRRWMELERRGHRFARQFSQEQGRVPSDREIAAGLSIPLEEWRQVRLAYSNRNAISLDAPTAGAPGESTALGDLLPAPSYQSFVLAEEDCLRLRTALTQLETTTRNIIEAVFFQDITQTEIARRLNLSPMTISRRIKKGIRQLWTLLDSTP